MLLYLVKWADGTFALVAAPDERALMDSLDQQGDPGGASWQRYDGPLWLEFPRVDAGLPPEGDIDPCRIGLGRPSVAGTDDGSAFADAVLAAVHPRLAALRERAMEQDRVNDRAELVAAVRADLDFALPGMVYGQAEGPEN